MRVLYLYSGTRKNFGEKLGVDYPDTQFYGLNHLGTLGIEAEFKEPPTILSRLFGFRLKHLFAYPLTRGYDIVFGSSVLYPALLKKAFGGRAKFVLLNIGLTRTLATREGGLKGAFVRWLISGLDAVVCLARFQVRALEDRFPALAGRVFYVPLGVDTEFYQPVFEGRKGYILAAGRDNGRDYAAVARAAETLPAQEFHIVCSPRNVAGITFPANVRVFFDLPKNDLYKKYREARLLLQLTKTDLADGSDCSGQTVLLDAMACGLPVVLNRTPYVEDYVTDRREAVVIEDTKPETVKTALSSLESSEARTALARAARAKAEQEFSTRRMAEHLAHVFKRL